MLAHQVEAFLASRDMSAYANNDDMGLGKSKYIIDTAAWLYLSGRITGLLVVAPNGVHTAWCVDQVPEHFPDYIPYVMAWWAASPNKAEREALAKLSDPEPPGLRILTMNIQALSTKRGVKFASDFLHAYRCLFTIDESIGIANPSAACTKAALKLGPLAAYRRILNGTPVNQGPADIWAQFEFLDPGILDIPSYTAFKARYIQLIDVAGTLALGRFAPDHQRRQAEQIKRIISRTPRAAYAQWELKDETGAVQYQHLDELRAKIAPYTCRRLKSDCLDLPPKTYVKRYVDLTDNQRRVYDDLVDGIKAELRGRTMTAPMAMTRLLRLQQVCGGFFVPDNTPVSEEENWLFEELAEELPFATLPGCQGKYAPPQPIDPINVGVESVVELSRQSDAKMIVWARFTAEIKLLSKRLREVHGEGSVVEYYGETEREERIYACKAFQTDPSVRFFVGNPASGGLGLTLHAGSVVVYFSNLFSLIKRLQSEDRAHRIGQKKNVTIVDIVFRGTVSEKVINALRGKRDVSKLVTGDNLEEWL